MRGNVIRVEANSILIIITIIGSFSEVIRGKVRSIRQYKYKHSMVQLPTVASIIHLLIINSL